MSVWQKLSQFYKVSMLQVSMFTTLNVSVSQVSMLIWHIYIIVTVKLTKLSMKICVNSLEKVCLHVSKSIITTKRCGKFSENSKQASLGFSVFVLHKQPNIPQTLLFNIIKCLINTCEKKTLHINPPQYVVYIKNFLSFYKSSKLHFKLNWFLFTLKILPLR